MANENEWCDLCQSFQAPLHHHFKDIPGKLISVDLRPYKIENHWVIYYTHEVDGKRISAEEKYSNLEIAFNRIWMLNRLI